MDKSKIQALIQKLDTSSDKAAGKIIGEILNLGKIAVPLLLVAAHDRKKPHIRKWSLEALGALADKRSAPILVKALQDERMTVRLHALRGLQRMKWKKASKQVARLLQDESGGIRLNALYALITFRDASVGSQILKCLSDEKWYVRQNACQACGELGLSRARGKLKILSQNDSRKAVREAAAKALEGLG